MESQSIMTLILAIIFFIIALLTLLSEITFKKLVIFISLFLSGFFMFLTSNIESYKNGQKDAILGKKKFKLEIEYHYNKDSNKFIPVDTFFIQKEVPDFKFDLLKYFKKSKKKTFLNYVIRPKCREQYLRNMFITSIIQKETKFNNVINHKENAVGYLQIRPIMVHDINRIVGYKKFTLNDRWNKEKSIKMFIIYQNYYNPDWDFEKGARIWNGGPDGHLQNDTFAYWEDVEKTLFLCSS